MSQLQMSATVLNQQFAQQKRQGWQAGKRTWYRKGHRNLPNLQPTDFAATELQTFPKMTCTNQLCRKRLIDGYTKCPQCKAQWEPVTVSHVATEVARRDTMARARGVPFALDKVVFGSTRRAKQTKKDHEEEGSSFGVLRDLAKNYVRKVKKSGYRSVVDTAEGENFFSFSTWPHKTLCRRRCNSWSASLHAFHRPFNAYLLL